MRFRLYPAPAQDAGMIEHCRHGRYVYNLAVEQWFVRRPTRSSRAPRYNEQSKQLTEARAAFDWLRAGSQTVQQQALRDFHRALVNWWEGRSRRPTWRKAGVHEGFEVVGAQAQRVEQLNRKWSRVLIPKVGWVKFRRTKALDPWKSYRVTLDSAGRWHIAFPVVPQGIEGPRDGTLVGVDRGIANTVALSTGERVSVSTTDWAKVATLQRRLARSRKGSNRRNRIRRDLARCRARHADRRKDWVEKVTTSLARNVDGVGIENLNIRGMTRSAKGTVEKPGKNVRAKAGLNRSILDQGWGLFARRLGDKIGDRLIPVPPPYTSLRCSACGHTEQGNRESQAKFCCRACGVVEHADLNAARNIAALAAATAAGRAVAGRGAIPQAGSDARALALNRQPQLLPSG